MKIKKVLEIFLINKETNMETKKFNTDSSLTYQLFNDVYNDKPCFWVHRICNAMSTR